MASPPFTTGANGSSDPQPNLARVVAASPDGLIVVDESGLILYANPAASDLLGLDGTQLIGSEFGHPLGRTPSAEVEVRGRDGALRAAEMRVTPLRTGGRAGWVVAIRDVTRRTNAERALLHAITQRDDALAVTSHELRNPLTVLSGAVRALSQHWDELPSSARLELLGSLERQTASMAKTVDRLLDAVRVDAGLFEPQPEPLRVLDLVLEHLDELGDWSAEVEVDIPPDVIAYADPHHVWTIVSNFLINSTKYGAPPFRVDAGRSSSTVWISVSDQGPGVKLELVPLLFTRYSTSSGRTGTGLGLWTTHAVAAANGGHVSYEPNKPRGARFMCQLPAAPEVIRDG